MPHKTLIRSHFYRATTKPNGELVCYIAGFNSKDKFYRRAISTLQKMGYDVYFFNHHTDILKAGNPHYILQAVDDITRAVEQKSKDYKEVICMGISLGTWLAYNVEKRVAKAHIGAFATGGVSFVPAIFGSRTFKNVAKSLTDNGYSRDDLETLWAPLDSDPALGSFPPDKSFIVFDGKADRLVNYKEAKRNEVAWAKRGMRIKLYTLRGRGHLLACVYFIHHTKKAISLAKQHHLQTDKD